MLKLISVTGLIILNERSMAYNEIAEHKAQLALIENDNETAVTVLMQTYGNDIYRFCRSMLNNSADAQDVLQTVFIQAFNGFSKFRGNSNFRTWLYSIARNRCLDHIKKNRRLNQRVRFVDELPEQVVQEDAYDPFMSKIIRQCLAKLSAKVRTAILLRFQSGHSYEEAAIVVQEKAGTLQARVARALPTLRRCIEDNGIVL